MKNNFAVTKINNYLIETDRESVYDIGKQCVILNPITLT